MREIKRYVRFYLQQRNTWKNQSDDIPRNIVLMFNYDGKRLCTLTGIKVAKVDWDIKKQRVKLKVKRASEVNTYLNALEDKINNAYYKALSEGTTLNNDYLMKVLNRSSKQEKPSFFDEWENYLTVRKHNLKRTSIEALSHSRDHFRRFAKGKRIEFEDIKPELVSDFAVYLRGIGHVDNTIHKHIKRLRAFMGYAKKAGLHNNDRYKDFNVQERTGRIMFLDSKEVKTLLEYQPESDLERRVLDNFLFGVFTAMRFSDYHALKHNDIKDITFSDMPGIYKAAHIRQIKTDMASVIPLLPEAVEIIERNKTGDSEFVLPRLSNATINEHIKVIGKNAGLTTKVPTDTFRGDKRETTYHEKWQLLSTHIGRKTFISLAAAKSIPIHMVASIAGHTVKTCMKFYAGVADKDKFEKIVKGMQFKESA